MIINIVVTLSNITLNTAGIVNHDKFEINWVFLHGDWLKKLKDLCVIESHKDGRTLNKGNLRF